MTDIVLDTNSHDIDLTSGGVGLHTTELQALGQRVKVRILMRKGEWYPDINLGVPYNQFLRFGGDKSFIDAFMQPYISDTPELTRLIEYSSEINSERVLKIDFAAEGNQGVIEFFTIGGVNVI